MEVFPHFYRVTSLPSVRESSSFRRSEYSSSRRLAVLLFLELFQACSHTLERVAPIPLERIPNWDEQMCYKQLTEVVGQEKRKTASGRSHDDVGFHDI